MDVYPDFSQGNSEDTDDLEIKRVLACEVKGHDFSYFLQYFSSYHKLRAQLSG